MDSLTKSWVRNTADEKAVAAGMRFDMHRAAYAVWFMGRYLRLYEGSHAGEPLILRGAHSQPLFASQEPWKEAGAISRAGVIGAGAFLVQYPIGKLADVRGAGRIIAVTLLGAHHRTVD